MKRYCGRRMTRAARRSRSGLLPRAPGRALQNPRLKSHSLELCMSAPPAVRHITGVGLAAELQRTEYVRPIIWTKQSDRFQNDWTWMV